jgi:DNA-binding SARP family transcriptional activator
LRVQRLVAFLALFPRPLHRAYVAGRLWLDASQEHAFGSLRVAVWCLRRCDPPIIEASPTHVALARSVRVDTHELRACSERVLREPGPVAPRDVDQLVRAGDLLPDWYDDWVLAERERLLQLRLLALETAAENLLSDGRYTEAEIAARAALTAEPLRETACLLLMRVCLELGNAAEASNCFRRFRSLLWQELQLEPSQRAQQLLARLNHMAFPS